jgi:hypothetical protein
MNKVIITAVLAGAGLCTGVAHAGNLSWSIGINTPVIGTVFSNGPIYAAPDYAAPRIVPVPIYVPAYGSGYVVGPVPVFYPRPVPYAVGGNSHGWNRHWHGDERRPGQRGGHDEHHDRQHGGHD